MSTLPGSDFDPIPSRRVSAAVKLGVAGAVPGGVDAVGIPVAADGAVPADLGLDRDALADAGFTGALGQVLLVPRAGAPLTIAVGTGALGSLDLATLRDAAAAFATAAARHANLVLVLPEVDAEPDAVGHAAAEGVLLARYRYTTLMTSPSSTELAGLTLVDTVDRVDALSAGMERARVTATAAQIARDLANGPPNYLTATKFAEVAEAIGPECGLTVEVFDRAQLTEMGCGGLLGVNRGSFEEPRMIKLRYEPAGTPTGRLTMVGKGIMYDSGGISLKPSDGTHATMKTDMAGAGAIFAAMTTLAALDCRAAVTGFLMCTDNMPGGTALNLGDVITTRGGTTVEILNTDAEGRLVMSDALVLAREEPVDAIVDIATLTGAALRALGPDIAAVIGNDQPMVDRVRTAARTTDEPVWQLPLERRYRPWLDSPVADLKNLGGEHAGAITAALFLAEFVGDVPWAHIDIAGAAQSDTSSSWRPAGATGIGARLLIELALSFTA